LKEKILCVDDEEMVLEALKMELMRGLTGKYIIETALSGEEALQIAEESEKNGDRILVVLSDQQMPGMTGEVLLSILNIKIPRALKILLTGYSDLEAVQYAINNAELYHYIQKPWDRENLILTVGQAIEKYHTRLELEEKTIQIIRMNKGLENTVQKRTAQLQDAIKELEAFTYTVSHDLKSPLRAIDYYAKFILEDYQHELNGHVTDTLIKIRNVCSSMFSLIEKLLQYAVAAEAQLELSTVDMDKLFRAAYQEIAAAEGGRDIIFNIEGTLPKVQGDAVLLKQVVSNLLCNAVKFTRSREKALIKVACSNKTGRYKFSVTDNGVGFDMAYASKLFGIFQRMHTQKSFEGSGVGLATVKKIIEKHHGNVDIESKENQGTTVSFTIPAIS